MATQEAAENPLKPIKNKTWILRTSIHCEGCKRKVKKILDQVHGVENVDIEIKQQKVIVTGNVEVDSLIKKLKKSGKNAELWPEKTEKKEKNPVQERNKEKQIKRQNNEQNVQRNGVKKEQNPMGNVEAVQDPAKTSDGGASTSGSVVKSGQGSVGAAQVDAGEVKSDEKIDAGGSVKVSEGLVKTTGGVQVAESKLEKKPEPESSATNARPPPAKEEKGDSESKRGVASENNNGGSDSVETHTSGKKKKKQGQNSNNMERAKSSAAIPASTGSDKHRGAGLPPISIPANHIPPRQHNYHDYPTPLHHYGPPPAYTVSHNTTYPTSSYTASYSAPPPHSYVYTYSGREAEPPPPPAYPDSYPPQPPPFNADSYPRQPLDSFEMFSDENPNGCFIM